MLREATRYHRFPFALQLRPHPRRLAAIVKHYDLEWTCGRDPLRHPLRPALYSLQGTNDLLASVAKVKKSLNPELELLGVVVNDYLPGPIISRQIRQEIEGGFGEKVFGTVVSRT